MPYLCSFLVYANQELQGNPVYWKPLFVSCLPFQVCLPLNRVSIVFGRCREKQRKESSRLQTVNRKLSAMNKLLMEENDRLQKQVSRLVFDNGYMKNRLHSVSSFSLFYCTWAWTKNGLVSWCMACCILSSVCYSIVCMPIIVVFFPAYALSYIACFNICL